MINKFISNFLLVIFYIISSLNCLQLFADPNWKKWLFFWMFLSFFLVILGFISIISKYKLKYWIMFFVFLFSCFLIYFKTWWPWDNYFVLNLLFWLSFLTQIFWISLEKKNETIEKQLLLCQLYEITSTLYDKNVLLDKTNFEIYKSTELYRELIIRKK